MSTVAASANSESAILARLIQARSEMTVDVAQYLLSFAFAPDDLARMNDLAERARNGILSEAEIVELDSYQHVGDLLSVMQSKARVFLRRHPIASSRQ